MKLKDNRVTKIDPNYKEIPTHRGRNPAPVPDALLEQHRRPARRSDHIPGGRPEPGGRRNNNRRQLRKRI